MKKTILLLTLFSFSIFFPLIHNSCETIEEKVASKSIESTQQILTFFNIEDYADYQKDGSISYTYSFTFKNLITIESLNVNASLELIISNPVVSFSPEYRLLDKDGNVGLDWTKFSTNQNNYNLYFSDSHLDIQLASGKEETEVQVEVRILVPSGQNLTNDEIHYYMGFETFKHISINLVHH